MSIGHQYSQYNWERYTRTYLFGHVIHIVAMVLGAIMLAGTIWSNRTRYERKGTLWTLIREGKGGGGYSE